MTSYSAFFSSGLLASHFDRAHTPAPPSSPILFPVDPDMTPTPAHASLTTTKERPRLRKRRSSITLGTSSMTSIKSPNRNAGAAFQRQVLLSPSRSRSGSLQHDTVGFGTGGATEENSLMGRMRSGSLGKGSIANAALRPRRVLRRIPVAPAPTTPLPDVPISNSSSFLTVPRPPLGRTQSENHKLQLRIAMSDVSKLTDSQLDDSPMDLYSLENGYKIDEEMKEN